MLASKRFFFLDLDGCVYIGDELIKGSKEAIEYLRNYGKRVVFITNNATKAPEEYSTKLRNLGIDASTEDIITSGVATAKYILRTFGSLKVLPIGAPALATVLTREGHIVVDDPLDAQALVVCLDFDFNYYKLTKAMKAIRCGAMFFATNTDSTFPSKSGLLPGAGAIVASIRASTGVEPFVVGKPNTAIFQVAMESVVASPRESVFVGDRIDTDVEGAKRLGAFAVLVLSGVTTPHDIVALEKDWNNPDLILEDLGQITNYF
ncbi:MAG: HAD-IIA family hydrolase [Thermoproteota archaeon]